MGRSVAVAELVREPALPRLELQPAPLQEWDGLMSASGDDGGVPQMPVALLGEIGVPRQEGAPAQVRSFLPGDFCHPYLKLLPGPPGERVEGLVVKPSTVNPPLSREGRSRVHARSALTTRLRGPNPKKQLRLITTQQGKKHSEPETGTFLDPSPVGERKPCFDDGH